MILAGTERVECDTLKQTRSGSKLYCILTATPFRDSHGNLKGIVEDFKDISLRKKVEEEREKLIKELNTALDEIKTLQGIIPICMYCKKIKNDAGAWDKLEAYIEEHSDADFSHGICPECYEKLLKKIKQDKRNNNLA